MILIHKVLIFKNFTFGPSGRFRRPKNSKILGRQIFFSRALSFEPPETTLQNSCYTLLLIYHRMVVVVALKKPGQFCVEKVQQSAFYFLEECLLSSQFIDLVHFTHSCVSYFKQLVWCVTFIAHKS